MEKRDEKFVSAIPLSDFPDKEQVKPGAQFTAQSEKGSRNATIIKIEEDKVLVDFNHPLAGVELHFEVEVIEVRDATEDELKQGHIHSEGCSH